MKFAQQLRIVTGVYSQYVCYKTLKKLIRKLENSNIAKSDSGTSTGDGAVSEIYASQLWWFDSTDKATISSHKISHEERSFIHTLENEIERVVRLHSGKMNELRDLLGDAFGRINGGFEIQYLQKDLDNIATELVRLEKFIRQSKLLFYKILKKYDKRNPAGLKVSFWLLQRLEQNDFWNAKFDSLVVGLSDAYAELRSLGSTEPRQHDMVKVADDVETFERKTAKYFVRAEDTMRVKMIIIKHLPLDIFGRKKAPVRNVEFKSYLSSLGGLQDATVTNSIYLDNDNLQMYHERTGVETARGNLIRIRWYGDYVNPPSKVFMERKTKNAANYTVDASIKERFLINESNVLPYLNGSWTIDKKLENGIEKGKIKPEKAQKIQLMASDIQGEIVTKGLGPAVRTVCRRSAFQSGKDQSLRFSLDTNLHMIDETYATFEGKWYRNMENPIKEHEVVKFPFGVLEIKTQKDPPEWVSQLLHSGLLLSGERFSKFQYGTLKLRPRLIRFDPFWFPMTKEALELIENESRHTLSPSSSCSASPALSPMNTPLKRIKEQKNGEIKYVVDGKELETFQIGKGNPSSPPKVRKTNSANSSKTFKQPQRATSGREEVEMSDSPDEPLLSPISSDRKKSIAPVLSPSNLVIFDRGNKDPIKPVGNAGYGKKEKDDAKSGGKSAQRTAKTFFANERTLLQWVNTVTFLSLTGLTLLNTDTLAGRVAGSSLILVTIIFALYAFRKYKQRLNGLESSSLVGFEDKLGPAVLVAIFCVVLLFVAVFFLVQDFVPALM